MKKIIIILIFIGGVGSIFSYPKYDEAKCDGVNIRLIKIQKKARKIDKRKKPKYAETCDEAILNLEVAIKNIALQRYDSDVDLLELMEKSNRDVKKRCGKKMLKRMSKLMKKYVKYDCEAFLTGKPNY